MDIEKLFEEFKSIKIEDITCKTWYDSVKLMNKNKKFSVFVKKININTMNFGSILLGFYSNENNDITIHIDDNEIKQKIPANMLTYPICNIILSKLGIYSNINVRSDKEIYGIFISLSEEEINKMMNNVYFSNYFYENKAYHLHYHSGKIHLENGLYKTKLSFEIEIPRIVNVNIVWQNILENRPNFTDILKYNDVIIKLSLDRHIWEKIKNNTEKCKEVDKIIQKYRKIFDNYKLYDSNISEFII